MYWNWQWGGLALGLTFVLAVAWIKPIGVSTEFVVVDGVIARLFNPQLVERDENVKSGYRSDNAYLNKSGGKLARAVAEPVSYGLIFVTSMLLGGFLGSRLSRSSPQSQIPAVHQQRFGHHPALRYVMAFVGGVLVLWGARLAGGCTSGHMMSGMMQTSVSGYLFAVAAFIAAVPTAILIYRRGGN